MGAHKEIMKWSTAYKEQDGQYKDREWFNQNWHSVHERCMELQRVVREKEPIVLEKKYLALTTLEEVQMSQGKLAFYGDIASVEREYKVQAPTEDQECKQWCYERMMAYKADEKLTGLYKEQAYQKEKAAMKKYDVKEKAAEAASSSNRQQ